MQKISDFARPPQSFKALKPKAKKSLNSIKALSLMMKDKLGETSTDNDDFYYKVAWNLSESQIANMLERSMNANNRKYYFMKAAKMQMRDEGIS